jgi:hypothetical protein
MTMIKGAGMAWRALSASVVAIFLLLYIFAIILNTLLKGKGDTLDDFFGTLPKTMWTLTMDGVFQDSPGHVSKIMMKTPPLTASLAIAVFVIFTMFSALMVLNMLIGAQCEVVSKIAHDEKESAALTMMRETMLVMLKEIDADGSDEIDQEELMMLLKDECAGRTLKSLLIDKDHLVNYLFMFYDDVDSLTIRQIMQTMLQFRGDRIPTMKDLIDFGTYVMWVITGRQKFAQSKRLTYFPTVGRPTVQEEDD